MYIQAPERTKKHAAHIRQKPAHFLAEKKRHSGSFSPSRTSRSFLQFVVFFHAEPVSVPAAQKKDSRTSPG